MNPRRRISSARTNNLNGKFVLDWGYLNEDGCQGVVVVHGHRVGISRTDINTVKQPVIQHPTRSRLSINRNHRALIICVNPRRRIGGTGTDNFDRQFVLRYFNDEVAVFNGVQDRIWGGDGVTEFRIVDV